MKVNIIGSGFSSMAASCYLAQAGYEVNVFEKNDAVGGRARQLKRDGFTFDLGPSWYWMPDVFERFFADFDRKPSDYYELIKLGPAYRVYFQDGSGLEISDRIEEIYEAFEQEEAGAADQLKSFLNEAKHNYDVAIKDLVYRPGVSPLELVTPTTVKKINQFFSSISSQIRKRFKSEKLIQVLEFPVLFLGAKPQDTPAFYNFMNHADFALGTWYPQGGMYKVVEGMHRLACELGVRFFTNSDVSQIILDGKKAAGLMVNGKVFASDMVLSGADYQHTEQLLPERYRAYSQSYWDKRTFAPSALLFYVGFDKKIDNIQHHMLFFDESFDEHAKEIYDKPAWPKAPLFYTSFTSVTDPSVAPKGHECGTFLIPLAPGLEDNAGMRNQYFEMIMERLERLTNQSVRDHVMFRESYCVADFERDYNSYKGNAYGMANTLLQTAFLRPKIKSGKVDNLFFTGQLTVPGPGVPPSLISGKIAAEQLIKHAKKSTNYEVTI